MKHAIRNNIFQDVFSGRERRIKIWLVGYTSTRMDSDNKSKLGFNQLANQIQSCFDWLKTTRQSNIWEI